MVDEEQVVILDVEEDRHDLEAVGVADAQGGALPFRFAEQQGVDVQEEARFRPQSGDAVDVQVPPFSPSR